MSSDQTEAPPQDTVASPEEVSCSLEEFQQATRDIPASIVGGPRARINGLTPPVGTVYFARRTYKIWTDHAIGSADKKFGVMNYLIDAYTYATGVKPDDPDFSKKGGKIYVVLLHTGYVKIYDNYDADIWYNMFFETSLNETGILPTAQLPGTGSGVKDGDDYRYEIDFGESLQMFRNNGNESFTFEAKYKESFTRVASKQLGTRAGKIELGVETTGNSSEHRLTEIYGLSVLTHDDPKKFPLSLGRKFGVSSKSLGYWAVGGGWSLHLGF